MTIRKRKAESTGTQEWTRVPVAPGPVGRYGHAVTMHDSRFFVFGGQAEGEFMNDLWAYDIKQREHIYRVQIWTDSSLI